MAVLTVQKPSLTTGINPTLTAAAAGGDSFINDGKTLLYVKNAHTAAITVTINSLQACNQGFDHNVVITVAAGSSIQIGPFPTPRFNDPTNKVGVTYSLVTGLTVGAVSIS
jgi:hypothetical protein